MLAISDGGSSKADWTIVLENGTIENITTTGFNPNYDSSERIHKLVSKEMESMKWLDNQGEVYYYGAGCWDPGRKAVVRTALNRVFTRAEIHVSHDMLAAARATCGTKPGIACILGTGSNSVLFDGKDEIDNVTNLGFLLGDEGSGAHIGKSLVQVFFYREMPADLTDVMEKACPNGRKDILDKVYSGGVPAAYLASFVQLFADKQDHPFVRNLFRQCFNEFIERHVCKYENHRNLPVHFVGSVAYHFKNILNEALDEKGLQAGIIIKKPIDNLLQYHLTNHNPKSPSVTEQEL